MYLCLCIWCPCYRSITFFRCCGTLMARSDWRPFVYGGVSACIAEFGESRLFVFGSSSYSSKMPSRTRLVGKFISNSKVSVFWWFFEKSPKRVAFHWAFRKLLRLNTSVPADFFNARFLCSFCFVPIWLSFYWLLTCCLSRPCNEGAFLLSSSSSTSIPFAGLFPPSENQFPLTEIQFPLTEIQFPLTENKISYHVWIFKFNAIIYVFHCLKCSQ